MPRSRSLSRRIIAAAEDEAAAVRAGADEYASGILGTLEAEVTRTLRGIERGLALLDERRAAYEPEPEPDPGPYAPDDTYATQGGFARDAGYDEDLDEEEGAPTAGRR